MPLFDLHCDTLSECLAKNYPLSQNEGHVDLERGRRLAPYGQVFAAWIPDSLRGEAAWAHCRALLDRAADEEARGGIRFWRKGEKLDDLFQKSPCVGVLAVEGGAALGGDLRRIDTLSDLNVKYITITWNGSNEWGHGCLSHEKSGLTAFGKAALSRMAAAGIAADVSHLNERGFWDVVEAGECPFLASHSDSYAVCPHPRNLTDAQFLAIVRGGGVVGLNLCADFLGEQTFEALERHLDRFWSLGGEDTVCFGCDMDGTALPAEWGGLSLIPRMEEYLYRKNYHIKLIQKLFFGNCYNFFKRL